MKNIYNLITDAFTNAQLEETDYIVKVEGFYKVTISHTTQQGKAYIFMARSGETLHDANYFNTLFTDEDWTKICRTINNQIQPLQNLDAFLNQLLL